MNQSDALETIQRILSREQWTVEDLESIAEVLRDAGYEVDNVEDEEDADHDHS
jgi:hypothetical protein